MKTAPSTCVLQMLATHLVHGRGCVLRGRAGGAQVGAHECVPEEVLLEERAAAALGDVSVRHAEDNAQEPHVVHARQAVVEAHPPGQAWAQAQGWDQGQGQWSGSGERSGSGPESGSVSALTLASTRLSLEAARQRCATRSELLCLRASLWSE